MFKLLKRKRKKRKKGFTIIELLAAIIILGILLIIAVPAISKYLDSSRSESYVTTARNIMASARNMVNEGKISFYDTDVSYYIPSTCIKSENSNSSPYGEFDPAYVIVNYSDDGKGFEYYWVSRDVEGFGVSTPVSYDDISESNIKSGLKASDIRTDRTMGTRNYTYVFNENCTSGEKRGACSALPIEFNYTGDVQEYRVTCGGSYLLEVWGAEGGYRTNQAYSGKGGYSTGIVKLKDGDVLYIYVGGSGNTGGASGGFNGGGARNNNYPGGGGASDIRINSKNLYARVIVAGGGGSDGAPTKAGGAGGGTSGITASSGCGYGAYGGSSSGNLGGSSYTVASPTTDVDDYQANTYAGFGFGGNGVPHANGHGGAGGGGWYGGVGTYPDGSLDDDKGGGGGSGYVYTSSTAQYCTNSCLLDSSYFMNNASTTSGDKPFDDPDGGIEFGHTGNGFIRITHIDE